MSKRSRAAGYIQKLRGELNAVNISRRREMGDLQRRTKLARAKWDGKLRELKKRLEYWTGRNKP
jgi:hypothetical protein